MSIGFSKTFKIEINLIAKLIRGFKVNPKLSRHQIMEFLGVGNQKAEAVVSWLGKMGLRDNAPIKREITPLGHLILKYDPYMEDKLTLWVLFYQLGINRDAWVWYNLTHNFIPYTKSFTYKNVLNHLAEYPVYKSKEKHIRSDSSIYLRSFISEDAFKTLNYIYRESKSNKTQKISNLNFKKVIPSNLSPYLVGYILYDYQERNRRQALTITIKEILNNKEHLGILFSLNRMMIERYLNSIKEIEQTLISISYTGGLDQVTINHKIKPLEILKNYYEERT